MRRRAISYKARSRNRGPNGSAALGPAPHAGGYGASGEEGASSSQQRTECMPRSNDLSRSLAALGPAAGSFTVDFPEHRQASGWRRFLPWVFGLLTLFALVLVVLHFGTIEQFTRLAWAARPEWFLFACVAQVATYGCASLVWRQALRRAGHASRRALPWRFCAAASRLFSIRGLPQLSAEPSSVTLALEPLAHRLAVSADRLGPFAHSSLRWLFVGASPLHLAKGALTLHRFSFPGGACEYQHSHAKRP
jgi:hypothetical protein